MKNKTKKQKQNPERSQAGHLSASISATEAHRHQHGLWDGQDHVGPAQRRVWKVHPQGDLFIYHYWHITLLSHVCYIFLKVALLEARKLSTMKSSLSPMRQAASFKVGKNKQNLFKANQLIMIDCLQGAAQRERAGRGVVEQWGCRVHQLKLEARSSFQLRVQGCPINFSCWPILSSTHYHWLEFGKQVIGPTNEFNENMTWDERMLSRPP